ncbi:MAG: O-antigen polysaccharide polymerase Wzy [Dehalococcoidia bacterium]
MPPAGSICAGAQRSRPGFGDILPHLLLVCMGLMLWLLFVLDAPSISLVSLSNLASIYALATVIMVGRVSPRGFWSAASLYLIILSLFHFGLTSIFGLNLPIGGNTQTNLETWFYTPYTNEAIVLSCIGIVSAGMGCLIAFLWGARAPEHISMPPAASVSAKQVSICVPRRATRGGTAPKPCQTYGYLLSGASTKSASFPGPEETVRQVSDTREDQPCEYGISLPDAPLSEHILDQALKIGGSTLVGVSICGWFLIVIRAGGIGILFSSYETMLQVVGESTLLTFTYYGIFIGIILLATAQPSLLRRAGFIIFGLWGLVALGLGLRSEVLFPTVTALVIIAKRKPLFSARVALILGVVLLSSIAAIRAVREVGIQNAASATVSASPLDGLTELGSSLRPVTETIYWRATGEPFIYGASYLEPFERQLINLIPQRNWKRLPAEEDPLVLSSLAAIRTKGQIGYSPIAEGYRNFSTVGVVLIMGLTGWLIGRMDLWPATPVRQALLGVVFVPILVEVRNDFTAVPFQVVVGCCVLGLVVLITRSIARIRQ